jgi:hypothetical protein
MATNKLLSKLSEIFDAKKRKQREKINSLKELLKKLKKLSKVLKQNLAAEKNSKSSQALEQEFRIVQAQRKKGLNLLKKLR